MKNRFLCQFRELGHSHFTTDCAFEDVDQAVSYAWQVLKVSKFCTDARILDAQEKTTVLVMAIDQTLWGRSIP